MQSPRIHFSYAAKHTPEVRTVHDLVVQGHGKMSDKRLRSGEINSFLDGLSGSTKFLAYQMLLYERFGRHNYVVGPRVQQVFQRTEMSKVTHDMVAEPHTGFYVALPDCSWKIWGGDRTMWHKLEGIYVSVTESVRRQSGLEEKFVVPARDVRDGLYKKDRGINILLWGAANSRSLGPADDALMWFNVNLDEWMREGEDIESFFARHDVMTYDGDDDDRWRGVDPADPFSVPLMPPTKEHVLELRESLKGVLRVVLNLCLYVNSVDPEVKVVSNRGEIDDLRAQLARKKKGKRSKIERRLRNLEPQTLVYVAPSHEAVTPGRRGSHSSPAEHLVRPHWQHYWVGSSEERRRVYKHKGMYSRGG